MLIRILAPETVSKIAAGEVVERPASVVKELVENSLDAGASQIAVEARGGGVSLIRIADNGVGIPSADAELAFHHHATSKIYGFSDLETIATLGFRGEALPSIAAVAEVEMLTRIAREPAGTYLRLSGGRVIEKASRARTPGTTITVRYLFRNLPARFKFLKSVATENSRIADLVCRYALAFPEVRFTLSLDSRTTLRTPGNGKLQDAIAQVYSTEVGLQMLTLDEETKRSEDGLIPVISGLVSPPQLTRSNRSYQSFFVNRRWIQSRLLSRAVDEAYQGLLMTGNYPIVVINISLPAHTVDVNVHPTKREVKFHDERALFRTVVRTIRKTLVGAPLPEVRVAPPSTVSYAEPTLDFSIPPAPSTPPPPLSASLPILRVLGQLANSYIIAEGPEGLYLIDQHAAHERVLFEKIKAQRARRATECQGLLQPLALELTPEEDERLQSQGQALREFGFDIEPFGDRTYLIRSVPALLKNENSLEVIREILASLAGTERTSWEDKIALSLACHGAVRAGQVLSNEESRELVRQLEQANLPRTCPHGRPTMIHLSSGELKRQFGRM